MARLWLPQGSLSNSGAWKNFKPSNTRKLRNGVANVLSGASNMTIAIVGDSKEAGDGAGTGTNGWDGARVLTPARRLAQNLTRLGIVPAQEVGVFGSAGVTSGVPGQYLTYDPRVTMNDWTLVSAGIGGGYYDSGTASTLALSFAPGIPFDTIVYWYVQAPSLATFKIDYDGTQIGSNVNAAGVGALVKQTVTVPLGTHTINWTRVSGLNLRVAGCTVYNSANKVADVLNVAVAGSTTGTWSNAANAWSPLNALPLIGADVYFVDLITNDWITSVPPATSLANAQAIISSCLSNGSTVVLCNPEARQVASTSLAVQMQYVNVLQSLQVSNDLPWLDFRATFETQEIAAANGWMYDQTHPNSIGYIEKARLLTTAFNQALNS